MLQAFHEASRALKQSQWERILYTISSQLAEATREIWRLYGIRLREMDLMTEPPVTAPLVDPDWHTDQVTLPTPDLPDIVHKRDRSGNPLHTTSSLASSNNPACMSAYICVNSRSIRRLDSDELQLTAMCQCASRYAGIMGSTRIAASTLA